MSGLARRSSSLAPFVLALTCGCIEPGTGDLVGSWLTGTEELVPSGYQRVELSFSAFGVFRSEVRSYGTYPGQGQNELSAYSRVEGTVRVEKDRLFFRPKRLVIWDRFYGVNSREVVEEPYSSTLYDQARYVLQEDQLTLHYLTYPFDAPLATSVAFTRSP